MPKKRRESKQLDIDRKPSGIYHVIGSFNGERIRKSLGTRNEAKAREALALFEAKLWKRHSYGEESVRTFEEAALRYMKQGGEPTYLKPLIKLFKGRIVGSIKPAELRAVAAEIYPTKAPATRNRQGIVPARAVIMYAHDLGWCGAIKVRQFAVPKSTKHKPVSRAWLKRFMAEADKSKLPHISAAVLFMNQTGARVSEALNLMGEHVDLGGRVAVLAKTKTEEWSKRALTVELVARISALGVKQKYRVFGLIDPKAFNRTIKRIAVRAGLEPRSTHSVGRHSFATNAMDAGARAKDAMDAGGWKSAKLFMETYVHSHEAGKNIAAIFDKQTGPIDMNMAQSIMRRHRVARKT